MVQKVPQSGISGNSSFKNFFINGDFVIAQRATSATAAGDGTYTTLDRMQTYNNGTSGAYTTAQTSLSAADQATTGQIFAYDIQCTTADTSVASGAYAMVRQRIEAQFLQSLLYGTTAAKTLTLSFYVKSNLTGTTSGCIIKHDSTAQAFLFEYTINSANTWEKKTIKITPPSNGGTIDNNNGTGFSVQWNLHIGSGYLGGSNVTWDETNSYYGTTNTLNVLSSTDNDLFLTGVQLEIGDTATDFEHLPRDVQLNRCLRYYYDLASTGEFTDAATYICMGTYYTAAYFLGFCHFPVPMRAEPTLTTTNASNTFYFYTGGSTGNGVGDGLDDLFMSGASSKVGAMLANSTDASGPVGYAGGLFLSADKICNFSAEL